MTSHRNTRITLIAAIAAIAFATPSAAAVRQVCASGCAFTTIQGAINASAPGDTVMILDPVHTEGGIVIGTDLTIAGDPAIRPIVQASPTPGVAVDRVLDILASADVVVQDLVIRHGRPVQDGGGGIRNSGELRLIQSEIVSNSGNGSEGGGILSTGALELVDSVVFGNVAEARGAGIACLDPCTLTMLRTSVDGNVLAATSGVSGGAGIYLSGPGLIEHSQISNNFSSGGSIDGSGGGIKTAFEAVLLIDTDVVGNQAGRGGGISSSGPLTVIRGSVSNNTAIDTFSGSGGIGAAGDPTVLESTVVSGNTGPHGAGISGWSANLAIRRTAIIDNHALGTGGALVTANGGLTVIEDSLIAGNTASTAGGVAVNFTTEVRIRNSTISGNTADDDGGGIWVGSGGTLSLSNVTVTENIADPTGLSGVNGGGIYVFDDTDAPGVVDVRNSIIAGNRDFSPTIFAQAPDCAGPITVDGWLSLGGTGFQGLDPACIVSGATPDLGGDQMLEPLADNGGPTMTHALGIGSPNIDTGDPGGCKDGGGALLSSDQRGAGRIATCDRGAFERGSGPAFFADDFETGGLWLWSAVSN